MGLIPIQKTCGNTGSSVSLTNPIFLLRYLSRIDGVLGRIKQPLCLKSYNIYEPKTAVRRPCS